MNEDGSKPRDDDVSESADGAPSDHSLLAQFRGGDQGAAVSLYVRYAERLRNFARSKQYADIASRVDSDDIVQSVFKSFFRGVSRGSYNVPADEELWNLFLVITLNKIRSKGAHHRAAKRDVRLTASDPLIDQHADPMHSNESTTVLLKLAVEEALDRLQPQHKQVVELRMEGYQVEEIAQRTGRSKRSVERVLQECRKQLSKLLQDQ